MLVSAEDAAATLRLVVPGFVALQVFYWFGLATKRADWRWLIYSLIASTPISALAAGLAARVGSPFRDLASTIATCGHDLLGDDLRPGEFRTALQTCANSAIADHNAIEQLAIAIAVAAALGLLAAGVWRLLLVWRPHLLYGHELNAWTRVLRPGRWVQVRVKDEETYYGWNASMADPVDADDLDMYLAEPALVTQNGTKDLGLEGILIRRDDILLVEVLRPPASLQQSDRLTWRERLVGRSSRLSGTQ